MAYVKRKNFKIGDLVRLIDPPPKKDYLGFSQRQWDFRVNEGNGKVVAIHNYGQIFIDWENASGWFWSENVRHAVR